jgi:multidrug resistance protein
MWSASYSGAARCTLLRSPHAPDFIAAVGGAADERRRGSRPAHPAAGVQPVTTDLYLPALPTLQRDLGTSVGSAQLTLSMLIIAFGLSQLLCGPLADRFGRRPILLGGLVLYTAAALGGAAATSIGALIAWRALQGVAMAAAVTCGRSIIRDLYQPDQGARVMARAMTCLGFIAVAAPLAGGFIVEAFGWHAALLALALFGAVTLAATVWRFRETLPAPDPDAIRPAAVLANWRDVVADPTFRAWAALSACTYGGIFCMLAGSSFVFIDMLGVGRSAYGGSWRRCRPPTSAARSSADACSSATACAARCGAAPGSRSPAARAWSPSASPASTPCGRCCCRSTCSRSATASTNPVPRPERSGRSRRRRGRRRRWRASS